MKLASTPLAPGPGSAARPGHNMHVRGRARAMTWCRGHWWHQHLQLVLLTALLCTSSSTPAAPHSSSAAAAEALYSRSESYTDTARTAAYGRGREFVVTAFGAVGDATPTHPGTNNTAAVRRAAAAVAAAGGGALVFPAGSSLGRARMCHFLKIPRRSPAFKL